MSVCLATRKALLRKQNTGLRVAALKQRSLQSFTVVAREASHLAEFDVVISAIRSSLVHGMCQRLAAVSPIAAIIPAAIITGAHPICAGKRWTRIIAALPVIPAWAVSVIAIHRNIAGSRVRNRRRGIRIDRRWRRRGVIAAINGSEAKPEEYSRTSE